MFTENETNILYVRVRNFLSLTFYILNNQTQCHLVNTITSRNGNKILKERERGDGELYFRSGVRHLNLKTGNPTPS